MAARNLENHTGHDSRASALGSAVFIREGLLEVVDGYTPLDEVLSNEGPDPDSEDAALDLPMEITVREFHAARHKARLSGMVAMLRYIWQTTKNPWDAMKRVLAITRKTKAELIRGMSATEVAGMLRETKAATSAREIKVVEGYLKRWGVIGFLGTGGAKSLEAREKYAKAAEGNTNRSGRKRPPDEVEAAVEKTSFPRRTDMTKADVRRLMDAAERARLGLLCGVEAAEIDLSRITPDEDSKAKHKII